MPLARFDKLEKSRKDKLFFAAREAFAQRGFDGAALQPILAEAGASKGGLYYWFEDRTDLFAWVAAEVLDVQAPIDGTPPEKGDLWAAWEERARRRAAAAGAEPFGPMIVRTLASLSAEAREDARLEALFQRARAPYDAWLSAGQERGAVRGDLPVDLLVELVLGVEASVAGWLRGVGESPEDAEGYARIARLETRLVQRLVKA